MTKRKLILLLDGTFNDKDDSLASPTNVAKFKELLNENSIYIFYNIGAGTLALDSLSGGLGVGKSIKEYIVAAYKWIAKRYNDKDFINEIYLFGFSRGAYMAKALSWILYYAGIPENPNHCKSRVNYFYEKRFEELKGIKLNDKNVINEGDIKFLGLWDAVKSCDLPDINDTALSPLVEKASHAMALDECRKNFPVLKFDKDDAKIKQMWFAGCHSDVGGGYEECELSDIACKWMASEAVKTGLSFKKVEIEKLIPDPLTKNIHNEYEAKAFWKLLGAEIRNYEDESVHSSVLKRIDDLNCNYFPMCKNYPS